MSLPVDLDQYKKLKTSEKVVADLESILQIIKKTAKDLKQFHYYSDVRDILHQMYDSKTVLEIHRNNHRKLIENKD